MFTQQQLRNPQHGDTAMRNALLTLAAALLFTLPTTATNNTSAGGAPDLSRNGFFLGVRVDMTRAEVARLAAAGNWSLLEESAESIRYRIEHQNGSNSNKTHISWIYSILFSDGKVRAISFDVKVESENKALETPFFDALTSVMSKNAESVTTDKTRMVVTYSTTDGRTMRFILNRLAPAQMTIDASVGNPGEEFLPLK
jgi:hypothetical protein